MGPKHHPGVIDTKEPKINVGDAARYPHCLGSGTEAVGIGLGRFDRPQLSQREHFNRIVVLKEFTRYHIVLNYELNLCHYGHTSEWL